jgi:hypothetical protein
MYISKKQLKDLIEVGTKLTSVKRYKAEAHTIMSIVESCMLQRTKQNEANLKRINAKRAKDPAYARDKAEKARIYSRCTRLKKYVIKHFNSIGISISENDLDSGDVMYAKNISDAIKSGKRFLILPAVFKGLGLITMLGAFLPGIEMEEVSSSRINTYLLDGTYKTNNKIYYCFVGNIPGIRYMPEYFIEDELVCDAIKYYAKLYSYKYISKAKKNNLN